MKSIISLVHINSLFPTNNSTLARRPGCFAPSSQLRLLGISLLFHLLLPIPQQSETTNLLGALKGK